MHKDQTHGGDKLVTAFYQYSMICYNCIAQMQIVTKRMNNTELQQGRTIAYLLAQVFEHQAVLISDKVALVVRVVVGDIL